MTFKMDSEGPRHIHECPECSSPFLDEQQRQDICLKLREALKEQERVVAENTDLKAITHWNRQVEYFTRMLEQGEPK